MKKTPKVLFAILAFVGMAAGSWGAGISLILEVSNFWPSSSVFRDVYGSGLVFGGELTVPITGGLHVWAGAEYYGKTGLLSVSEEVTKVRIIPVYAGLKYHFGKSSVRPYIGAAAAYFLFNEENPLGSVNKGGIGVLGQAGLLIKISGPVSLDLFGNYRACTLKTDGADPLEAKIDGISAGLGLVFRF